MTTIHVNDAEAGIIRAALAEYAGSLREEARLYRGGYSARGIELHVLRLNVEALMEAMNRPPLPAAAEEDGVIPIDSWQEAAQTRAA